MPWGQDRIGAVGVSVLGLVRRIPGQPRSPRVSQFGLLRPCLLRLGGESAGPLPFLAQEMSALWPETWGPRPMGTLLARRSGGVSCGSSHSHASPRAVLCRTSGHGLQPALCLALSRGKREQEWTERAGHSGVRPLAALQETSSGKWSSQETCAVAVGLKHPEASRIAGKVPSRRPPPPGVVPGLVP